MRLKRRTQAAVDSSQTNFGDSSCMTLAKKDRCRNALQRRSRRRKFARRCEINFLPFVSQMGMDEGRPYWGKYRKNYLSCVDDVRGFSRCPQLRPLNETTDIICNHLRQNTRRCSTTQGMIHTSCRMFETCDQAVVISGGWNQLSSGIRYERNIQDVYRMLRTYGFKKRNIQIFFANGMPSIHVPGETGHKVHPTALKLAMRYHIRSLCHMSHCADSLVIYMNSPADNDGSAFLWDVNYDGLAEKSERYSVKEFKRDLASCRAKEVHVIVDQSFSGEVADAFRNSHNHQNVIVYASSKGNEYSANDEYTRHWTNSNHTHSCSFDIHEKSKNSVSYSTPTLGEGRTRKVQKTIFGAPCDVTPPFTKSELRRDYLGCQNMPTAMWVMRFFRNRSPIIELNSDRNRS